jgi:hypothetical protein
MLIRRRARCSAQSLGLKPAAAAACGHPALDPETRCLRPPTTGGQEKRRRSGLRANRTAADGAETLETGHLGRLSACAPVGTAREVPPIHWIANPRSSCGPHEEICNVQPLAEEESVHEHVA